MGTNPNTKENICQICGGCHPSYENLLASCTKCGATEHVYCMRTVIHEVPEDWVCESCLSGNDMIITESGGKEDALVSPSDVGHRDVVQSSSWQVHSKKQKPVETGKVKFIPHEEVIKLSSGATKTRSPLKSIWNLKPGSTSQRTQPKSKNVNPKFFSNRIKATTYKRSGLVRPFRNDATHKSSMVNQKLPHTFHELKASERTSLASGKWRAHQKQIMDAFPVPAKDINTSENKMENLTKKSLHVLLSSRPVDPGEKAAVPCTKDPITMKQPVDALILHRKLETSNNNIEKELVKESCSLLPSRHSSLDVSAGGKTNDVAEHNHSDVQEGDLPNLPPSFGLYLTYLPAVDATWKGGFSILDSAPSEIFGGFQAQPSSKVHRKAYEISRNMPPVLQVKMLPQFHFLADLFHNDCPDLQDVALYFFPADNIERSRQNYVQLFKHMENNGSIMITYIHDVELLIFTSKQLNIDSQNILSLKSEYFFWGLFRSTNDKTHYDVHEELPKLVSPLASYNNQADIDDNIADEDMEVDMVGGKNVGKVDVVIPKNLPTCRSTELPKTIQDGFVQKLDSKCPTISREGDSSVRQLLVDIMQEQRKDHGANSFLSSRFSEVKIRTAYVDGFGSSRQVDSSSKVQTKLKLRCIEEKKLNMDSS